MIAQIQPDGTARYFDIRKLTPTECFRLMGVPEAAIEKLTSRPDLLSKNALYKLAGNSIVCDVLYYIYRNIWAYTPEPGDGSPLSLFGGAPWQYSQPKGKPVRVVTLCSGYDSQCLALDMLKEKLNRQGQPFDWELMAWSEFDPERPRTPLERQPAVIAHNLLFPQYADRNVGDMTKADWGFLRDADIDLLTYSTPCQSISMAGKREGIARGSGTRSAVLWYTENAIATMHPKFLLQENVAALVNKTNLPDFHEWCRTVERLGYTNYIQILNAKDYGVPQNRERVFMLSVRDDLRLPEYHFPRPFRLTNAVADLLDEEIDTDFLLKAESAIKFLQRNEKEPCIYRVTDRKFTQDEINEILLGAAQAH